MDENEKLLSAAEELLHNRDDVHAGQTLAEAHAADIAHVFQQLPMTDRVVIFRSLRPEQAGDVLSELDDATLLELVRSLDDVEVSFILDRMPAEHAADVVDELSTEHAEKILDLMEEEKSEEIQETLEYPEDSAGRLMSADIVAVRETSTVEEAIQHIRKTVTEERPFGVYAVDDHGHLIGRLPLRRLLLANPGSVILGILEEDVVSVNATMDKEEVARLVAKYDLVTVPVVDEQNRLVGTISVDDVIDIVQEEASEDIFRMAGSDAAELERRSPPWRSRRPRSLEEATWRPTWPLAPTCTKPSSKDSVTSVTSRATTSRLNTEMPRGSSSGSPISRRNWLRSRSMSSWPEAHPPPWPPSKRPGPFPLSSVLLAMQ
jgi:magnesium transporter